MGVFIVETDVFDFNLDVVMHQANVRCTFGAGIAKAIRLKYPDAYKADTEFSVSVGLERLGKFSWSWVDSGKFRIFNLYGQDLYESVEPGRFTRYDELEKSIRGALDLLSTEPNFKSLKIGINYGLGSVLGGGKWSKVREIFERVSDDYGVDIYACKLPEAPVLLD